jgi:hypothetical protein
MTEYPIKEGKYGLTYQIADGVSVTPDTRGKLAADSEAWSEAEEKILWENRCRQTASYQGR